MLDWYDKYDGPKVLNRTGDGRWKCILAGKCPVSRGYGNTPEEAIKMAIAMARLRREAQAGIAKAEAEKAEREGIPNVAERYDDD